MPSSGNYIRLVVEKPPWRAKSSLKAGQSCLKTPIEKDNSAMKCRFRLLLVTFFVAACPGAPGVGDTSGTEKSSGPGDVSSTDATTSGDTTTSSGTATTEAPTTGVTTSSSTESGSGSDTLGLSCGDGRLEDGEACDDGNMVNGDGCNNDCSPSATMVWEFRSEVLGDGSIYSVATSADGEIFIAGEQGGPSDTLDRWVAKFSGEGEMVWSKNYDEGEFEAATAIGVREDAVYVAGATKPDDRNLWVARLDLDGNTVWEDQFDSGFGDDFAKGLSVVADGVVVVGVVSLEGGLGTTWTRRYAANGDVQWTDDMPFQAKSLYNIGPAVAATAEQVVVGFYRAPQPDTYQAVLYAYPPEGGAPLWNRDLPTNGGVFAAANAANGDIVLALQDIAIKFVVDRTSSAGEVMWSSLECVGDAGFGVAVDGQGDVVAIGFGKGQGGLNIRLCKFTPEGQLRWGKDIDGGLGDDSGLAVAILPDDRIVAAGNVWGGKELRTDAWLAVFSP